MLGVTFLWNSIPREVRRQDLSKYILWLCITDKVQVQLNAMLPFQKLSAKYIRPSCCHSSEWPYPYCLSKVMWAEMPQPMEWAHTKTLACPSSFLVLKSRQTALFLLHNINPRYILERDDGVMYYSCLCDVSDLSGVKSWLQTLSTTPPNMSGVCAIDQSHIVKFGCGNPKFLL